MKTVILAGGLGTRLSEETSLKPKPMVEIGERPILWHIMKHYAHYGFQEFVVPLGYKGNVIRRYFLDYAAFRTNLSIDLSSGHVEHEEQKPAEPWRVHLVETGDKTSTGGRVFALKRWVGTETFFLTYGDGISLEHDALSAVAAAGQLRAFRHQGFWQPMRGARSNKPSMITRL